MGKQDMVEVREKTVDAFIFVILLLFGIYLSILYYGYQVVPDPDFTGFVDTGRQLLSLHLPDSYKRAPTLGILQVLLSKIIGGPHPELTAGWVLSACLLPLNLILLWLVGRKIVGRAALWIALIAIINPWVLKMAIQPIAESLFLFCILLSFYAILHRSRWVYLVASVATMVRYEGAMLILIAFVIDMLERKKGDSWFKPFLYAALSSMPLGLWMLGTLFSWQAQGTTHYLNEMGATSNGKILWLEYVRLIWRNGVQHLFITDVFAPKALSDIVGRLSKGLTLLSFIFGLGYGLFKRNWNVLALAAFLSVYLFIHSVHAVVLHRFLVPVCWIFLLICVYGMIKGWAWINRGNIIHGKAVWALQGAALIVITLWLSLLALNLSEVAHLSPRSISVPYVLSGAAVVLFIVQTLLCRNTPWLKNLTITLLVILIGFSNQFWLVETIKDGKEDFEFKLLAEWYVENANTGETMLTTLPNLVEIYAPASKYAFIHTGFIPAEDREAFIEACYSKGIDYVAWDSRSGSRPGSRYAILWNLKNIEALEHPRNSGPFIFVEQIRVSENRFVNIFQLKEKSNSM